MLQRLQGHWGFTRLPFGRDLAPSMLHRHSAHGKAVARITWTITERALGVITGEVGVGKTVALRAALAGLDQARHIVIYLGNPTVGTRGIHQSIVTTLAKHPGFTPPRSSRKPPTRWPPSTPNAAEPPCWSSTRHTCSPTLSSKRCACSPTTTWTAARYSPACS